MQPTTPSQISIRCRDSPQGAMHISHFHPFLPRCSTRSIVKREMVKHG